MRLRITIYADANKIGLIRTLNTKLLRNFENLAF